MSATRCGIVVQPEDPELHLHRQELLGQRSWSRSPKTALQVDVAIVANICLLVHLFG